MVVGIDLKWLEVVYFDGWFVIGILEVLEDLGVGRNLEAVRADLQTRIGRVGIGLPNIDHIAFVLAADDRCTVSARGTAGRGRGSGQSVG